MAGANETAGPRTFLSPSTSEWSHFRRAVLSSLSSRLVGENVRDFRDSTYKWTKIQTSYHKKVTYLLKMVSMQWNIGFYNLLSAGCSFIIQLIYLQFSSKNDGTPCMVYRVLAWAQSLSLICRLAHKTLSE